MIKLNEHEFGQMLKHHTSEHLMVSVEIDGKKGKTVLLKDVQHHAVFGHPIHVDFHAVSLTKKLSVEVEIELVGEPKGVTQQGGVLEHLSRHIQVECLPSDIVEKFELDVSELMLGESLSVGDIKLDPAKYTVLTTTDIAIAAVATPRVEEEPVEEEEVVVEEGETSAEPEVITAKPDEGEETDEKSKD